MTNIERSADDQVRLNLGCGPYYADGWINIDRYVDATRHPDVIADVSNALPIKRHSVSRIYAGHIVEHLPYDKVGAAFNYWHDCAASGAELLVVGPDVDRAWNMHRQNCLSEREAQEAGVYQRHPPGQSHLWDCTEDAVMKLLQESMWTSQRALPIQTVPDDWPLVSRIGWQFAIVSTAST